MKNKRTILIVIIICIIIYTIPNIFYLLKFNNSSISPDPALWGQYGDFVGGSINPILSIVNIFALVYLSYIVAHLDDNRAKESINAQKLITITQMRHQAVSELSKELSSLKNIQDKNHAIDILENLMGYLVFFKNHNQYLFNELFTDEFDEKYLVPLANCINDLKVSLKNNERDTSKNKIIEYLELENLFISELNKFILKEITPSKIL